MTDESANPPSVPEDLVQAGLLGKLVVWVGAGASFAAGFSNWKDLRAELLEHARRLGTLEDATYQEASAWFQYGGDPLDQVSFLREIIGEDALRVEVARRFQRTDAVPTEVHRALALLDGAVFVTTNYDDLLERAIAEKSGKRPRVVLPDDLDGVRDLEPGDVLKLHGDASQPASIVLAHEDDFRLSGLMRRDTWRKRLESLLQPPHQTILVGYSFRDVNLRHLADGLRDICSGKLSGPYWLEVPRVQSKARASAAGLRPLWVESYSDVPAWLRSLVYAVESERNRQPMVVKLDAFRSLAIQRFEGEIEQARNALRAQDYHAALDGFRGVVEHGKQLLRRVSDDPALRRIVVAAQLNAAACLLNLGRGVAARTAAESVFSQHVEDLKFEGRCLLAEILGQLGDTPRARSILPDPQDAPDDKARDHVRTLHALLDLIEGQETGAAELPPAFELHRARRLLDQGRFGDAAELAERMLEATREDALLTLHWVALLIRTHYATRFETPWLSQIIPQERRVSAVEAVERALSWLESNPPPRAWRRVETSYARWWAQMSEDPEGAERAARRRQGLPIEEDEPRGDIRRASGFAEAEELANQGKLDAALARLPKVDHPWTLHHERALLFAFAGRLEGALTEIQAAITAFPGRAPIEHLAAQLLLASGRTSEALPHARAAFESFPVRGHRLSLGQILLQLGPPQDREALDLLRQLDDPPTERAVELRTLAAAAERMDLREAARYWDRYLLIRKDDAPIHLQRAKIAYILGEHERAPDLAWRAWEEGGRERLDARELYELAGLQTVVRGSELPEGRRNRVREVVKALAERFGGKPEAEQYRIFLLNVIRGATVEPPLDFKSLEDADLVASLSIDDMAADLSRQQRSAAEVHRDYRRGQTSFDARRRWMGTSGAFAFQEIVEPPDGQSSLLSAPAVTLGAPSLGDETLVLLGPLELLLLDHLNLWSSLRRWTAPKRSVVVFEDVFARVNAEAVELANRDPHSEWEKNAALRASDRAHRLQRQLGTGLAEGWVSLRPRTAWEGLPPLKPALATPEAEQLYRAPLAEALSSYRFLEEADKGILVSADFFSSCEIGKHARVLRMLAWSEGDEVSKTLRRHRALQSRALSLPSFVHWISSGDKAYDAAVTLAELGFVDALLPVEILRLGRRFGGLNQEESGRILKCVEWMLREKDHAGRKEAQILLGGRYGGAIAEAWGLAASAGREEPAMAERAALRWSEDEASTTTTTLLTRAEAIDEATSAAVVEQILQILGAMAISEPAASFVQTGAQTMALSSDTRAGRMWAAVRAWAGTAGARFLALSRGLRQVFLMLDNAFPAGGPPLERSRLMLLPIQALQQGNTVTGAVGGLSVLGACWSGNPVLDLNVGVASTTGTEQVAVTVEKILEHGAQFLSRPAEILGEDTARFSMPILPGRLPLQVVVLSEALLLRAKHSVAKQAAVHLATLQGPHDGRAYHRLMRLEKEVGDSAARREVARGAVFAPFRIVREDPSVLAAWTAQGQVGGFPQSARELREMLSEPAAPPKTPVAEGSTGGPGRRKLLFEILNERAVPQGEWGDRKDLWNLMEQVSETPGLTAAVFLPLKISNEDAFVATVAKAYLALLSPDQSPAGALATAIIFLRAASARRPVVGLGPEGMDLRVELPKWLVTTVRRLSGPDVDKDASNHHPESDGAPEPREASPSRFSFSELEGGILRLCSEIVEGMPDSTRRDSLWLTYRLHQWFCAQLERLSADEREAALRTLSTRLPEPDPARLQDVSDALHPAIFDRRAGLDYRLATVLYAIAVGEEQWTYLPEGPRTETVMSVSSAALEEALLEIASRPLNELEAHLRSLGEHPSRIDWFGPIAVPDLALLALLSLRRSAFFDVPVSDRLRWLADMPTSMAEKGRLSWMLVTRILDALLQTTSKLSREERRVLESWLRELQDAPSGLAEVWRRRGLCALFGAGEGHLASDARAVLLAGLSAAQTLEALADYFHGVARAGAENLAAETDAVLESARQAGIEPVSLLPALGRLMMVSRDRHVVSAAAGKLRELGRSAPFSADPRTKDLLDALDLR